MIGSWPYFGEVNNLTLVRYVFDGVVGRIGRKGPILQKGRSSTEIIVRV